jgi:hypothetical protein
LAPVVSLVLALTVGAATRNNDDSCDVGVAPAATLLLPLFEVDVDDPSGETTIFTITNVTNVDRIARVTLWTDYAFPVVTFNIQLTGYGVQGISLYDVIARGVIKPPTGLETLGRGPYSKPNPSNDCAQVYGKLPPEYVAYMQAAFLDGVAPTNGELQACNYVGNKHDNAIGYATIDLVRNCSTNNPFTEQYWTEDLAYDNVLIGDYQQVHSASNFAQGSPLVHVRAIPEGGTPAQRMAYLSEHGSHFTRTFYGHYQPARAPQLDSREPLPSVFAARWINGSASGFNTFFKIWREGKTGPGVTCATHDDNVMNVPEAVQFDEAENAVGDVPLSRIGNPIIHELRLPATSFTRVSDTSLYPSLANGAVSGWLYLNLDNSNLDDDGSSNWVVISMRAEGRYSVDMDAAPLGNGCSAPAPISKVTTGSAIIGPRP